MQRPTGTLTCHKQSVKLRLMQMREELEKIEAEKLAPYAMKSAGSKGRRHAEEEHPMRTAFQRDRDRIIHSSAFRRLEYKTQVFVNHEGDYYRTRLTHTLEVAQITRTMARALRLNEDLAEAIALAHDLGHTPFGHSGERLLNQLMKDHGGFEHNRQSLRVVDYLEDKYPHFKGLNLSWEVREGIIKHSSEHDNPDMSSEFEPHLKPTLEAEIVNLADEIAYNNHDIDDGLTSKMIDLDQLMEVTLFREIYEQVLKEIKDQPFKVRRHQTVRQIINVLVTDLIQTVVKNIKGLGLKSVEDVRNCKETIVSFSPEILEKNRELKQFLKTNLYRHYRVIRMAEKANRFMTELFDAYKSKPEQLPPHAYEQISGDNKERIIADYIAGMTDRYALDEYKKLFDPYEKV